MNKIEAINATTYEATLFGGDKVEIGDLESADFKPCLKLNRWDGECFVKVSLPTNKKQLPIIEGNKVKWIELDLEADFYPLAPRTVIAKDKEGKDVEFRQCELGGFEFEVILKKKPKTNQIVLNIETQGLKFYYQPELTQEEIADGCIRPDNVVGSYAVYHATRTNMHSNKADAEKYKCGIAFHIYRPKITDAVGKWVWGELNLDEQAGTLTTTISQEFLDKAVYPISTGTTNFGYEGIGATAGSISSDYWYGWRFECPSDGISVEISYYYNTTLSYLHRAHIYSEGTTFYRLGYSDEQLLNSVGWHTFSVTGVSLEAATEYRLGVTVQGTRYKYDAGTTDQQRDYNTTYGIPPETWSGGNSRTRMASIYCTYEAGGPETKTKTYTLAARLKKIQVKTYTLAVKLTAIVTKTKTYTLTARLFETIEKTYTLTARLKKTQEKAYSLVARLKKIQTETYTLTAKLVSRITKTYSLATRLKKAQLQTYTLAARLTKLAQTKTYTLASRLLGTITKGYTLGAKLVLRLGKAYTLAAKLVARELKTYTLGARLQQTITKAYTLAGRLFKTQTATYTLAARLFATLTKAYTVAAKLVTRTVKTYSLASRLFKTSIKTYTIAARLGAAAEKAYTIAARLLKTTIQAYTLSTKLVLRTTKAYTLIGKLISRKIKTYTSAARLFKQQVKSYALSARLLKQQVKSYILGARLFQVKTVADSLSARLFKVKEAAYALSARLASRVTVTYTLAVRLFKKQIEAYTIAARFFKICTKTYTLTAKLTAVVTKTKTYTLGGRIIGTITKSYTLAVRLVGGGGGWTGKISGVTNPAKVMGIDTANIAKVKLVA